MPSAGRSHDRLRGLIAAALQSPMTTIDLNSDLGESFGRWTLGSDGELMKVITSANVACGFHAGDPGVMRATVRLAREAGVAVGAHPGLPDLAGFGRRNMAVSPGEVEDMVLYQVGALAAIAAAENVGLQHVKPHGALYNMAVTDRALADAIARAVRAFDSTLVLFALPETELEKAGLAAGLRVAREGFADRAYEADGSLTPRTRPGAVLHSPEDVVGRAIRMARDGIVRASNGSDIPMRVDTICTHGDTPSSHELTRQLRAGLEADGISVAALRSAP
jgi:5-oxoprolinase (ATP-hydrolysing) subunit A